ncbi:MAG: DUF1553 domain-containing protein [Paludisphaera borealis]|uniref:DUF1553 domain-containing protein n=1 Tax=Paludisphaera borealis TaxID=1387353 RepID=UPI00283F27DE|nr:DUF1553 domain-containing protein [Paludisphaera borealis]MDR3620718.1 DUF1553 domain-containing protein [Paludisphaera borealis]
MTSPARSMSVRFGTTSRRVLACLGLGAALAVSGPTAGAGDAKPVDYLRDVKPLLDKRCFVCHGALKQKSGLRLDTAKAMLEGGDGGPVVEPGKSGESLIVEAVTRDESRMPPEGEASALSKDEVAMLRAWIDQGAKAPADEKPQTDPRKHWSFRAPERPAAPAVSADRARWVRNPIDAFLAVEHQKHGLTPGPRAEPAVLIRRLYLDLIGLLPRPEEVRKFESDPSDQAYEAIVDRLLASPQYGERWGRHWMDIWRYSDWDGFGAEVRESQPHIWRWRDWIVESLNADRGYDKMIVAMLAADEAAPGDADAVRATGYLVRNWYLFNRDTWLDATVEHTSKAFLGITLNCAKCHDHKYDPIAQTDYYGFRAFFEPHKVRTDAAPGEPDATKSGLVRVYDADLATPTFLYTRGDSAKPVKDHPIDPKLPKVLQTQVALAAPQPIAVPRFEFYRGLDPAVRKTKVDAAQAELKARQDEANKADQTLAAATDPTSAARAKAGVEAARKGVEAAVANLASLTERINADDAAFSEPPAPDATARAQSAAKTERRADLHTAEWNLAKADLALADADTAVVDAKTPGLDERKKAAVAAKTQRDKARLDLKAKEQAVRQEAKAYSPLAPQYPRTTSGKRLALARWLTHRDNPLTARVSINHMWMRHFGTPLVASVFDFGVNGSAPSHPALLDWLSRELVDSGWSMKPIHRLMVTSAAYRMRSSTGGPGDPNLTADPGNRQYWRMNARRMEAETVRDNLLWLTGGLDLALGGPDLDPETAMTIARRSLYFRHSKEKRVPFLRMFDSSNVTSCYRRTESVVPQQALALANSPLSLAQARRLAATLETTPDDDAFIATAFERVLGRKPRPQEQEACAAFLKSQAERLGEPAKLSAFPPSPAAAVAPAADKARRAREDLVHVLFNHNDFVMIY